MTKNKVHANYVSADTRASREIDRKEIPDSIFIGMASSGGRMSLIEKCYDKRIILLFNITPIWILLFVALPEITKLRQEVGAYVFRFIEPLVSIPLNYFILISSEVFNDYHREGTTIAFDILERSFLNVWFLIGAVIYSQGAGMFSTAAIITYNFENAINANNNITTQYPAIENSHQFHEDLEYIAGNYLQLFGGILIIWAQIFAYRRQLHYKIHSNLLATGWILGGILNGILLTAVLIEIPWGTLVGLIYVILEGIPLALYLLFTKGLFSKGKRLVLQTYLISRIVTFVLIIVWIVAVGGFKDRKTASLFI